MKNIEKIKYGLLVVKTRNHVSIPHHTHFIINIILYIFNKNNIKFFIYIYISD